MTQPKDDLKSALKYQLSQSGFEMLDLIQIPAHGDRNVRIQTLDEAIEDFDRDATGDTVSLLVQVKAKANQSTLAPMDGELDQTTGSEYEKLTAATYEDVEARSRSHLNVADPDEIYSSDGQMNAPYLIKNADLLFSAGEYALAKNIYRALIASKNRPDQALFGLGRCLEAEGKLDEACLALEEAITFNPSIRSYEKLGSLLIRTQKDQHAAETLERALHLKEINQETRFELEKACGNCWVRAKNPDAARPHYLEALKIRPSDPQLFCNLGALELQAEDWVRAKQAFEQALQLDPKNAKALAGMGSIHYKMGERRIAHDYYAKSLALDLSNADALFYLVKCAYEIKSYATAARFVTEYVESAPVNTHLLYSLAGLQYHLGRTQESVITINRILELQPEHTGAKELLELIGRVSVTG